MNTTVKLLDKARWWGGVLVAAGRNWIDSQAFIYAAALAFFTAFLIAPVMIVAVAVVAIVLGPRPAERLDQLCDVLAGKSARARKWSGGRQYRWWRAQPRGVAGAVA